MLRPCPYGSSRHLSVAFVRAVFGALCMFLVAPAAAQPTPGQQCEAGKSQAVGKYFACRSTAAAKLVRTGNTQQYGGAILRCEFKFAATWQKLEARAGASCPDEPLDQATLQSFVDQCSTDVATALGSGVVPTCQADLTVCQGDLGSCTEDKATCGENLAACEGDNETCGTDLDLCEGDKASCEDGLGACHADLSACQGQSSAQRLKTGQATCYDAAGTVIACSGTGEDGEFQKGVARSYTDNGDGTITDNRTGLVWEKLSDDGSIHDWDNIYTWTDAVASKVAALNAASFAGHTDWRVPNINELQSVVNFGRGDPAIDPIFSSGCVSGCSGIACSCTHSNYYWSSTTYHLNPPAAWAVAFLNGWVLADFKTVEYYVRAVRGGS
jgi:hypothetical protein